MSTISVHELSQLKDSKLHFNIYNITGKWSPRFLFFNSTRRTRVYCLKDLEVVLIYYMIWISPLNSPLLIEHDIPCSSIIIFCHFCQGHFLCLLPYTVEAIYVIYGRDHPDTRYEYHCFWSISRPNSMWQKLPWR